MDNAVTSLVSCRLNTSGSNTNSCSICKGENWEWHLRCTSSVSSGSKSNHTKDCNTPASHSLLQFLPSMEKKTKQMLPESQWGGLFSVLANALWPDLQSRRPPSSMQCKARRVLCNFAKQVLTCALFTVTWRRDLHHEVAVRAADTTFRF